MTEFKIRFCPAGHQMELKNWQIENENKVYDAGQDWYCSECNGWYHQNSEGKWEFIESQ